MKKENCWEYMKCGRNPGGNAAALPGVCPVSIQDELSGIHGGENAGRACWAIDDSLCPKVISDKSETKFAGCWKCEFFHKVKNEERSSPFGFIVSRYEMMQIQRIKQSLRAHKEALNKEQEMTRAREELLAAKIAD